MTRRLLLPIVVLLACLSAPFAAHAAFKTGISDQVPGSFTDPAYKGLKLTVARYITPYDVMTLPADNPTRIALDTWIKNATAARQDVLVSFEHSHTPGKEKAAPSAARFRKDLLLFMKAYPKVKSISPWNEVNRCNR